MLEDSDKIFQKQVGTLQLFQFEQYEVAKQHVVEEAAALLQEAPDDRIFLVARDSLQKTWNTIREQVYATIDQLRQEKEARDQGIRSFTRSPAA